MGKGNGGTRKKSASSQSGDTWSNMNDQTMLKIRDVVFAKASPENILGKIGGKEKSSFDLLDGMLHVEIDSHVVKNSPENIYGSATITTKDDSSEVTKISAQYFFGEESFAKSIRSGILYHLTEKNKKAMKSIYEYVNN